MLTKLDLFSGSPPGSPSSGWQIALRAAQDEKRLSMRAELMNSSFRPIKAPGCTSVKHKSRSTILSEGIFNYSEIKLNKPAQWLFLKNPYESFAI